MSSAQTLSGIIRWTLANFARRQWQWLVLFFPAGFVTAWLDLPPLTRVLSLSVPLIIGCIALLDRQDELAARQVGRRDDPAASSSVSVMLNVSLGWFLGATIGFLLLSS